MTEKALLKSAGFETFPLPKSVESYRGRRDSPGMLAAQAIPFAAARPSRQIALFATPTRPAGEFVFGRRRTVCIKTTSSRRYNFIRLRNPLEIMHINFRGDLSGAGYSAGENSHLGVHRWI